jgi:hypothetical protein
MARRSAFPVTLVLGLAACLTAPAAGQTRPEWRVGVGYLISRPNDQHLWGLNVEREQRLAGPLVYRGVGSVDFLGGYYADAFDPMLVTVGGDVGLRANLAPLTGLIALGPTLGYFIAQHHFDTICQGGSCFDVQRGYQPGPLLAVTGSAALGMQVSSVLKLFGEVRGHLPSRIGRSGAADDPYAAFVEMAVGVSLLHH